MNQAKADIYKFEITETTLLDKKVLARLFHFGSEFPSDIIENLVDATSETNRYRVAMFLERYGIPKRPFYSNFLANKEGSLGISLTFVGTEEYIHPRESNTIVRDVFSPFLDALGVYLPYNLIPNIFDDDTPRLVEFMRTGAVVTDTFLTEVLTAVGKKVGVSASWCDDTADSIRLAALWFRFEHALANHDWFPDFSDSVDVRKAAEEDWKKICSLKEMLSKSDSERAQAMIDDALANAQGFMRVAA